MTENSPGGLITGKSTEQAYWQEKRDRYLDGVSERIRSMCLGSLVLIWGMFTGESKSILTLSRHQRVALLSIGITVVLVLALDLVEYLMGYQASLQRSGDKSSHTDYNQWKNLSLSLKQILGYASLIALVVVLASMLYGSAAQAQENNGADFIGHWCGGDHATNQYVTFDVRNEYGRLAATLDGQIQCNDPTLYQGRLVTTCGSIGLVVHREKKILIFEWKRVASGQVINKGSPSRGLQAFMN